MRNVIKNLLLLISVITIFTAISANFVYAQQKGYVELAPLLGTQTATCPNPNGGGGTVPCVGVGGTNTLGAYINTLYKIAVAGASVLAVLMLIIGGFTYVSTDAIDNKEEGKSQIKAALGGLLLVLASWVILYTVNPQLTSLKIASTALESRDLSALFNMGQAAQQAYSNQIDQLSQNFTASQSTINNLQATANDMQSLLDAVNVGGFGGLTDAQQAQYDQLMSEYGGPDGLQEKINELNGTIDSMTAVTQGVTTFQNAAIAAARSPVNTPADQTNLVTQVGTMNSAYSTRVAQVNSSTVLTTQEKTQAVSQLTTAYNTAVTSMCSNIPTTMTNPNYDTQWQQCNALPQGPQSKACFDGLQQTITNPNYTSCVANKTVNGAGGSW